MTAEHPPSEPTATPVKSSEQVLLRLTFGRHRWVLDTKKSGQHHCMIGLLWSCMVLSFFQCFYTDYKKGPCVPTAAEPRKMISFWFLCVSGVRNGQWWGGPFLRPKKLILEWRRAIEHEPFWTAFKIYVFQSFIICVSPPVNGNKQANMSRSLSNPFCKKAIC